MKTKFRLKGVDQGSHLSPIRWVRVESNWVKFVGSKGTRPDLSASKAANLGQIMVSLPCRNNLQNLW